MDQQALSDLIAYVTENQGDSFAEEAFNNADGLVLAELAYIDWGGLGIDYPGDGTRTLAEAISDLPKEYLENQPQAFYELLMAVKDSERFGSMCMSSFFSTSTPADEVDSFEQIEQFAAVVFSYVDEDGDVRHYISFRGTDSTLEGWCEDFNMAYDSMTEAQKRAVEYLNSLADRLDGYIQLGGHSKGGNNAMYAYLFCEEEIRERIFKIFIYDSPGFIHDLYYEDADGFRHEVDPAIYERMVELLKGSALCPYDSIIGQLLKEVEYIFVDTDGSLLLDHDGFLWRLDPVTGEFVIREQSPLSKYINELTDEWIGRLPVEYRETFMKAIWCWIYSLNLENFDAVLGYLAKDWKEALTSLISYIGTLPEEERRVFMEAFAVLVILALDNALEDALPGYETIREKILQELEKRGICSMEDLWYYLAADPIANTMDLLQSIVMDWDTLVALVQAGATVTLTVMLVKTAIILAQLAMHIVIANLPVIAAILAAVVFFGTVIDYIRSHWEELKGYVTMAVEFVRQKVEEFIAAMRIAITTGIHMTISSLVYLAKEIAEEFYAAADAVVNVVEELGRLASAAVSRAIAISNPLLYTILRTITGLVQSAVTIDMVRLQGAVDSMDSLATRVANMDSRLDTLYRRLCISNIEQSEGVFTSLANLYHLASADINVDQGNRIRRKANALSDLFSGYADAERWVLSQMLNGG